jgi:peptidoglycan glycosyltransferase
MYSNPTYNNNDPFAPCHGCSQYNGVTQGLYPPGSTFKVVTSAAAIDTGAYTPNSTIVGNSPLTVSGVPLQNDGNQSWGPISLKTALVNSVNTVFAQVGQRLGRSTMETYMKRFGFYSTPPVDFPSDQMSVSGNWLLGKHDKLLPVTSDLVDLGRMSIGQATMLVTPLQMAMVAAGVANGGNLMQPRLTSKVVNQNGQVVASFPPRLYSRVMKPATAHALTDMMTDVVEEGTGQAARLDGVKVAGKTGTASTGGYLNGQPLDDAWFIGFAPVQDPKIAVAVTLQNVPNGFGGIYAAPIAAQEIRTLLAEKQ